MTALLEFKQKIKGIYAQYEMYLLPLLKFVLALVYFIWINTNMGYMTALDNIFVVLILSLICCILPSGMMIFAGFALMVGHCYALGIEVAAFLLVLILFMMILFLRFSSGKNIVLVFTPLAFAFDIPVLLPIGCGLLSSAVSALPAAGGVIIYYFVRTVRIQSQALLGMDSDIVGKLTLLSDSLMKNGEMWLTLIAFIEQLPSLMPETMSASAPDLKADWALISRIACVTSAPGASFQLQTVLMPSSARVAFRPAPA